MIIDSLSDPRKRWRRLARTGSAPLAYSVGMSFPAARGDAERKISHNTFSLLNFDRSRFLGAAPAAPIPKVANPPLTTTICISVPPPSVSNRRRRGSFRQRMMGLQQLTQPFRHHVRVNLRRGDVGMPQQHLQTAQIGATGQKMRREGVPQHVG